MSLRTAVAGLADFVGKNVNYRRLLLLMSSSYRRRKIASRAITSYGRQDNRSVTEVQSIVLDYLQFVNYCVRSVKPKLVFNMDETPGYFDLPSKRTLAPVGSRGVELISTGNEKSRYTIVVTCSQDGTMLKPMIIFKGK